MRRLFFLTLLYVCLACSSGRADDFKEYNPLNEGNRWAFKDSINEIKIEEIKPVIAGNTAEQSAGTMRFFNEYGYDSIGEGLEGIKLYEMVFANGTIRIVPREPLLIFPYEKKSFGQFTVSAELYSGDAPPRNLDVFFSITFDGKEDVEVPAGKFVDCLKISSVRVCRNRDMDIFILREKKTFWLVRGIGKVKEMKKINLIMNETLFSIFTTYRLEKADIAGALSGTEAPSFIAGRPQPGDERE